MVIRKLIGKIRGEMGMGDNLKKYEREHYTFSDVFTRGIIVPPDSPTFADVSFYQARMIWTRYPHDGAIIRIGQNVWKDSEFEYNYSQCKEYNIAVGGYWFYDDRVSPESQFEIIKSAMLGKSFEMELFIDYERKYGGAYFGLKHLQRLIGLIRSAGIKCKDVGVYTGYYFWTDNTKGDEFFYPFFEKVPLWLAWYAQPSAVKVPVPWSTWRHWQYGTPVMDWGQPTVEIDANRYNGTRAQFENEYLGGAITPPPGGTMTDLKVLAGALNGRKTPGGVLNYAGGFVSGDLLVADQKQIYYDVDWYRIIKQTRAGNVLSIPDGYAWASAGTTYQYLEIIQAPPPVDPPPTNDEIVMDITGEVVIYVNGKQVYP